MTVNRAAIKAGIREDPATRILDNIAKRSQQLPPESRLELLRRLATTLGPLDRQAASEIFRTAEVQELKPAGGWNLAAIR